MSGSNRGAGNPALATQQGDNATGGQEAAQRDDAPGDRQTSSVALPVEQATGPNEAAVAGQQAQSEQSNPYALRDLIAQEVMADAAVWMAVAAFLTFAITSFGTLLIWRQVKLTREAVEDTGKATKAMQKGNRIALRSLAQNRDSARAQLRAYISVTGVEFKAETKTNRIRATVHFRNNGQTPAKDVQVHLGIYVLDWREYKDAAMPPKTREPSPKSKAVVGAGDERSITNTVGLREGLEYTEAMQSYCLIAQGHITYSDVFNEGHRTDYKLYVDDITRGLHKSPVNAHDGNNMT